MKFRGCGVPGTVWHWRGSSSGVTKSGTGVRPRHPRPRREGGLGHRVPLAGLPTGLLTTLSGPGTTSGVGPTQPEIEDYTFHSLNACTQEYLHHFPNRRVGATILVHLEASGLDSRDMRAPIRGISRFLHARWYG